jgi:hypothetical protein
VSNVLSKRFKKICPAFHQQESVIKDIIKNINHVDGLLEKAKFAKKLKQEANVLLSCPDYARGKTDCKNCHFIANLRKKIADLIIEVKKLG